MDFFNFFNLKEIASAIPIFGSVVNALAVVIGSTAGLLLRKKLPQEPMNLAFGAFGLITMYLGFSMALKAQNILILIFSLVLGALVGETLKLQAKIENLGEFLRKKFERFTKGDAHFVDGFVTAFLLYCTGSMVVLGTIEEGLGKFPNLLLAKSLMDGLASVALAASMGIGVLASAAPLLIFQGSLTFGAKALESFLTAGVIDEMTATGGIILMGLSLSILEIKKMKVMNLLPALLFAALFGAFFH